MSAQAAAKAASHAAKTAAQSDRGFLNRGAKRDPELYVCASCLCSLTPLRMISLLLANSYSSMLTFE